MSVTSGSQQRTSSVARARRRPPPRPRRRAIWFGIALALLAILAFGAFRTAQAARAGIRGKQSLLAAEQSVKAQELGRARLHLVQARASFEEMRRDIDGLGPLLAVARQIPLVRAQVRGIEAFGDAGVLVSDAGIELVGVASDLIEPGDVPTPASGALNRLKQVRVALDRGVVALQGATAKVHDLDGYRMLGPLSGARNDLRQNLDRISDRAVSAQEGLDAIIAFLGGSGPRRYLLFSQNPDELRPTGGFLGTYGVLTTGPDAPLALERYEPTENWMTAHPEARVPNELTDSVFRQRNPPLPQQLANVNAVPDWPRAANLAAALWQVGGEQPVDGVLSVTPACLAKILGVVGPVDVPDFGETVNSANVVERFDFYTREAEARTPTGLLRKQFVVELAKQVMTKLFAAESRRWIGLGQAMGQAFELREAMAWSRDEEVIKALTNRGWDGRLPTTGGDFVYDAEFEYAAKNGRALRRTFDHNVQLSEDGSARITTTLTISNPSEPGILNPSSLAYHTMYGPIGATLDGDSDTAPTPEPPLSGHPAVGWYRAALPGGTATLKVVWRAPAVAKKLSDGSWAYGLWFMHLPDHEGDVLNLEVVLPEGMQWKDEPPPARTDLNADLVGVWRYGR